MRVITFLCVVLSSAACSGGRVEQPRETGDAGASGAGTTEGCDRDARLGTFSVHFEQVSGDCGAPADERAVVFDLDQTVPCVRAMPDEWSADSCTRRQHLACSGGAVDTITELTLLPDGSLTGRETRAFSAGCTGTYDVTWTRQ